MQSRASLLSALLVWLLVTCLLPAVGRRECAAADDDLLAVVKAGSRNARSVVASGRGKVSVRCWKLRGGDSVSETQSVLCVAFAGDAYRLSVDDEVVRDDPAPGRVRVKAGTKSHQELAIRGYKVTELRERRRATLGDASRSGTRAEGLFYSYMSDIGLLDLTASGNGIVDIECLERSSSQPTYASVTTRVVGREPVGGAECILVETAARASAYGTADRVVQMWVDPAKGFVMPRVRAYYEGGPFRERTLSHETTAEFSEHAPDVWYPAHVTRDYYRTDGQGKPCKYRAVEITYAPDFALNARLSQAELSLELPSGTRVYDEVLDAQYTAP